MAELDLPKDGKEEAKKADEKPAESQKAAKASKAAKEQQPEDSLFFREYTGGGESDFSASELKAIKKDLKPGETVWSVRREANSFTLVTHPHGRKLTFQAQ